MRQKSKKNVPELTDNNLENMSPLQLSRWIALFEGVNIIADEAKKYGKRFNYMHIKQPALEEYVNKISMLVYKELTGKTL